MQSCKHAVAVGANLSLKPKRKLERKQRFCSAMLSATYAYNILSIKHIIRSSSTQDHEMPPPLMNIFLQGTRHDCKSGNICNGPNQPLPRQYRILPAGIPDLQHSLHEWRTGSNPKSNARLCICQPFWMQQKTLLNTIPAQ